MSKLNKLFISFVTIFFLLVGNAYSDNESEPIFHGRGTICGAPSQVKPDKTIVLVGDLEIN